MEIRSQNKVPSGRLPPHPSLAWTATWAPSSGNPAPDMPQSPPPGSAHPSAPPPSFASQWRRGPIKATVGVLKKGNQSENSDSGPQVSATSSLGRGRQASRRQGLETKAEAGFHTAQPARTPGAAKPPAQRGRGAHQQGGPRATGPSPAGNKGADPPLIAPAGLGLSPGRGQRQGWARDLAGARAPRA